MKNLGKYLFVFTLIIILGIFGGCGGGGGGNSGDIPIPPPSEEESWDGLPEHMAIELDSIQTVSVPFESLVFDDGQTLEEYELK